MIVVVDIDTEERCEQEALPACYFPLAVSEIEEQERSQEADGEMTMQERALHLDVPHQGRSTRYDEDIEDITAHHVAHAHVTAAAQNAHEAHDELRQTRTKRHDSQTDDKLAHIEPPCQPASPISKAVCAPQNNCEANNDKYYLKPHTSHIACKGTNK